MPRPPRPSELARKRAKKRADEAARRYAKAKYGYCVTCGAAGEGVVLQWAHLLPGGVENTRYHKKNFAQQCAGCNLLHEHQPQRYTLWFLNRYGVDEYADLCAIHDVGRSGGSKMRTEDFLRIALDLEVRAGRLENGEREEG